MANGIELENCTNNPGIMTARNQNPSAIFVKHACKYYGTKRNPFVVLDNLNMNVPKGSIYGLLGASGCGKTTLLGCILGRKRLNSGNIWVLGKKVGSRGQRITAHELGYMPQELALYGEFTIRETMKYFGWIAGMNQEEIDQRLTFLIKLLMLPTANQLVRDLSGGQQRRVSLAAALLHQPELLILDEPTSGVDPLLRQIIWDYLVEITKEGQTTVIITTHYIDETKQADWIGLMRGGYLLKEESPQALLQQFGTDTLEAVFLKLSVMQNLGQNAVPGGVINDSATLENDDMSERNQFSGKFGDTLTAVSNHKQISTSQDNNLCDFPAKEMHVFKISDYLPVVKKSNVKALVIMNYLWMLRNWPVMCFLIFLPVIQIALFCAAIGHDPVNLPIAVVNYETSNSRKCDSIVMCNSTNLSCNYLTYLERKNLTLVFYDSEDDATASVLKGDTYASIVLRHNYTKALQARLEDWWSSADWNIESSEIDVFRDLTSKDIANYLRVYLYQAFQKFFQDYLKSCDLDENVISLPIRWYAPIYGLSYPNFTDFATPGMILTCIFFLAVALTAGAMLIQRNQGSFERALIIGITPVELLTAHIICQFCIMVVQMITVMICAFAVFGMTMNGSLVLVVALTTLTGFCGMCFGFAISSTVDSERMATYAAMGSFFPFILLSGIIWPIEAMHYLLQLCSFFLPLTKATESMRSILQKGWGLSNEVVYTGFISVGLWIILFLGFSLIILKFKKG